MNLQEVVRQYVASRKAMSAISTRAAGQAINAVMNTASLVTRRELDDMVAEEAIRQKLPVHFEAVEAREC